MVFGDSGGNNDWKVVTRSGICAGVLGPGVGKEASTNCRGMNTLSLL